jgi:hypothetical protein
MREIKKGGGGDIIKLINPQSPSPLSLLLFHILK